MKIIQISSCGHERNQYTQTNKTLYALDDEGNVYEYDVEARKWYNVPSPIPKLNKE
jgi:hypothetical protein